MSPGKVIFFLIDQTENAKNANSMQTDIISLKREARKFQLKLTNFAEIKWIYFIYYTKKVY
jgi:hypothetical protein